MALVVWLPLNGTVDNQGASGTNPILMGTGITWSAGKIGQAATFPNNCNSCIHMPGLRLQTGSIAAWILVKGTGGAARQCIISEGRDSYNDGVEIWTNQAGTTLSFKAHEKVLSTTISLNQWYHVVGTFGNGEVSLYLNGELKTTPQTYTTDMTYQYASDLTLGKMSYSYTNTSYYFPFNGQLNDVRIYNHCLSAAEVHEISQGLVLHYKLDNVYNFTDLINRNVNVSGYNNHGGTNNPTTITYLSQQYNGDRIIQYSATPNDSVINSIRTTLHSHGIYNWSKTFKANTKYVFWIYYKPITHADTVCGGTASNIGGWTEIPPVAVGGGWYRVGQYRNGSVASDKTDNIFVSYKTPSANAGDNIIIYFASPHLLEGTTEIPLYDYSSTTIEDSSGYNNNGTFLNDVISSSETAKYSVGTNLTAGNAMINCGRGGMVTDSITVNFWLKSSSWANPISCTEGGGWNFEAAGDYFRFPIYISGVGYKYGQSTTTRATICNNQWHMLTGIYDRLNQKIQIYVDGELDNDYSAETSNLIGYHSGNVIWLGAEAGGSATAAAGNGMAGLFSDLRIYCTPLSATDIKQLYEMGGKVDNKGGFHTFELKEESPNIFFDIEKARTNLEFKDGLSRYTQTNCQVTLTENGYRIYRPPNLTTANDGNTMFGGLKLVNQTTDTVSPYNATRDNVWKLQKGHSYLIAFHVKGQSSNPANYFYFINNMGWGVGGVGASPTVIASSSIPTDFNGEKDCYYIFTINDHIVKTSNDARSGYDGSSQYLSYRHFTIGWTYSNTGTLGTDVYLTNFRLYDITSYKAEITKAGQADFSFLIEQLDNCKIRKSAELIASEFIEL